MIWQDLVISIAAFGLAFALIPTILGNHKPAISSIVFTIACLLVMTIAFFTLELWISVLAETVGMIFWSILFFQKRALKSNKEKV